MRYGAMAALAALVLSACGSSSVDADADGDGTVTTAEMNSAAAKAGTQFKPQPGQYSTTTQMIEIDMPGAPEAMKDMMGSAMSRTSEYCLTSEMAERGFQDAIKQGQSDDCKITTFTMDGGDVDMAMTCAVDGGLGEMNVAMNGEVTPTTSDMTMAMKGRVPELGEVAMKMAYRQKRIGDCK